MKGSLIPLSSGKAYPSTEQTLAAAFLLLNGGDIGQVHDITKALSTAFAGRQGDLRSLISQLDTFSRESTTKPVTSSRPPIASTGLPESSPHNSSCSTGDCRASPRACGVEP
jgi:hypothetical protein